jgi:hypothetical protein
MAQNDAFTARRNELERAVLDAARELLTFTRAASALIPIPDSDPPAFVAIGEPEHMVDQMMDQGSLR